ncbi:hypothetical protein Misp01_16740 [Microtetraspora sp. NBRC 13810]|uniref:hypothetical protein n=1 Tax=Microtetraspora sp. NBRC 13810 TaxID=3030990 RepID=UPI0024A02EFE|nr:hypothetical protein [Microtetraspora sp. NBRC 13810]GLW06544.1 hypothetical protein Misp01_16740 [Microtetraspora sp. NBRC 13810]
MRDEPLPRDEMRAAFETSRSLGPDYDAALAESFADKVEATLAARVRSEVDARLGVRPGPPHHAPPPSRSGREAMWLGLGSMLLGIPLTGIAANEAGFLGLLLAWAGIIMVNLAAAVSRRL